MKGLIIACSVFIVLIGILLFDGIQRVNAQPQNYPISWKVGSVHGDIDLYVIQTSTKCFYITHHDSSTGLFVTDVANRGCN